MRFHPTALKRLFLALLLAGFSLGSGRGQITDATGAVISPVVFQGPEAITVKLVDPPVVGSNSGSTGGGNNTQWLLIEFRYSVKPKAPLAFLDAVEFRIWAEGRDLYDPKAPTADGLAVALTGKVTYVNLAANREVYGSFYIPPSAMARYSTRNGSSDFTGKFNIHMEAYVGGTKVDYFDMNKEQDPNWFSALRPVSGMVYPQDKCPFIVNDTSRYPEIRLDSAGQ